MSQPDDNASVSRKGSDRRLDPDTTADVIPLESTIPPTPLRDLLAADGASVYVLTGEQALVDVVQEAGGEQYPIFLASSWKELRTAVSERRCGVVLLDIESVSGSLVDRLSELQRCNPLSVPLIASPREHADSLLGLLGERKIHRLLIKPATVGITRLLLESSINRYIDLRQRARTDARFEPPRPASRSTRRAWLGLGAVFLATVGGLIVFGYDYMESAVQPAATEDAPVAGAPAPAALEASLPVVTSDVPVRPEASIEAASVSPSPAGGATVAVPAAAAHPPAAEDVTVEPGELPSSTAPDAGGAEPARVEQSLGPADEDIDAMFAAVETALIGDELDAAAQTLAELRALEADASRIDFLTTQLQRARAAAESAAQAAELASVAAAPPSELTSLVSLVRARLAQGQVNAPAGDSALDYLARARALDPEATQLVPLATEIGRALMTLGEVELAGGRFDAAESLFVRAQALGLSDEDEVALELSLRFVRDTRARAAQDELLALARERVGQGRLLDPPEDSALAAVLEVRQANPNHPNLANVSSMLSAALSDVASAALAESDWPRAERVVDALEQLAASPGRVATLRDELDFARTQAQYLAEPAPASELSVVEFEPPVYPNRALTRQIEGWVDLEFVINREGRPRDVAIVGAEPEGLFEPAALTAAESYVFVPFERDGHTYERRVELRIRFAFE